MAASYPGSVKTFTTRSNGASIDASHMNDVQDEIAAVESGLINGFTHMVLPFVTATHKLGTALYQWLEVWGTTLYAGARAYLDYDTTGTDSGGLTLYRGTGAAARGYYWRLHNIVTSGTASLLRFVYHNGTSESVIGSLNSNGMLTVGGLVLTGIETPAGLATGSTHNLAIAATTQIARLNGHATPTSTVTGISASQVNGRVLTIVNVSANNIILSHQDAGSTAANQFTLPGAANVTLNGGDAITLWYDTVNSYWRALSNY